MKPHLAQIRIVLVVMDVIDAVIIVLFVIALVRGTGLGLVRQVCSTIGLVGGLFLGVFVQGKYIHLAHTPAAKAMLALAVVVTCIGVVRVLVNISDCF